MSNYQASATSSSTLEKSIVIAILAILFWAPLPLGSNRDWSSSLLIFLISLTAVFWTLHLIRTASPILPPISQKTWGINPTLTMLTLLVATQIWVAAQWLFGLSDRPGETFRYLMLGLSFTLLFTMILSLFNTRKRLTILVGVIVASGVLQAFWGSMMVLSGIEYLFGVPKECCIGNATGTFVNRNHLAGYLELAIGLGIGLMLAMRTGEKITLRNTLELIMSSKVKTRLAIIIMVIALVMTHSRMGNSAFFISLLIMGALFIVFRKENRARNSLLLVSFIVIDMVVISQYFGLERLKDRLVNTEITITQSESGSLVFDINDLRGIAFTNTIPLALEKPLIGYGAGSYEVTFIGNTGPNFGKRFDHAHNDYLQFWVEFGLIGALPLLIFALIALAQAIKALRHKHSFYRSGIGFGAGMAIIALMIHSSTDFNLQIPANALTFVTVCAIAVLANTHTNQKRHKRV